MSPKTDAMSQSLSCDSCHVLVGNHGKRRKILLSTIGWHKTRTRRRRRDMREKAVQTCAKGHKVLHGSGALADLWVAEGNDPWARFNDRMNTGLGPLGSYVNVPCPPSSASSAASGCANMGMPMAAPGLSFPTRPAQTLSTVPNQGCCSQVSGQNADNVAVGRQLLDRMNPAAPNVPAFVRPQGNMRAASRFAK